MQVQWRKLISKTLIWVFAEILLSVLGLDDLADYGEFLQQGLLIQPTPMIVSQIVLDR